jgi:type VI secretion system secreted protein VgrG
LIVMDRRDLPAVVSPHALLGSACGETRQKGSGRMASMTAAVGSALGAHRNHLRLSVASGDVLDIRQFTVHQRMSALFEISLVAHAESANVDFDAVIGQEASFTIQTDPLVTLKEPRRWTGICNHVQQLAAEPDGLSTYQLSIVPTLWLATQRRNHRMFQQISEPDIVLQLLGEWGIAPDQRFDKGAYKKRKYRVQYGESDFDFLSRMLEDAGISFFFEQQGEATKLVLADAPHLGKPRVGSLPFNASPTGEGGRGEHATAVRSSQRVRPGKVTMRDHDYRLPPAYKLISSAAGGLAVEDKLESFHYTPGAFLFGSERGDGSPVADDRGKVRTDEGEAAVLARKRLAAKRGGAKTCTFATNATDLAPGVVTVIDDHPRADLSAGSLLVIEATASGTSTGEWSCHCEARSTASAYHPPLVTPRPKVSGVESATVVGPAGEEIHTDEFGRVRVHFHWDRESKMNEKSSCWIHVSQPWGGAGYGGMNLPRIGQEVIVDFLGGDPDRPVIVGRMYTNLQKAPYTLPANKTQSGWKSNSTGGGGGYNEIMFEDAGGSELVRMQAEKDLHKLVKHDEDVTIGNDRTKQVGHDDIHDVGHDRERSVGNDETVTVGNDRAHMVGNNESVTVGNSRSKSVGVSESLFVGISQNETIGMLKTETVGVASIEMVGVTKTLTVGAVYAITVGGAMNTAVGGVSTEEVGSSKKITVADKIEIVCGKASIVMEQSGKIDINGTEITVNGTQLMLTASGQAQMHGSAVKITGDPIDLN